MIASLATRRSSDERPAGAAVPADFAMQPESKPGVVISWQPPPHARKSRHVVMMGSAAILLDVDGTLLDIAITPGGAVVPPELRINLARLSARARGAVALVSGRALSEIDRLFAPLRLAAVGGHGAEIRPSPEGKPIEPLTPALDPQLKECIATQAAKIDGLIIEDKGYSLALHYRQVPQARPALERLVKTALHEYGHTDIEALHGKAIIEIKPSAYNKGTGVRTLMNFDPFAQHIPIYAGDDFTDEYAFAALCDLGGFGISVGHRLPGANAFLKSPAAVRGWIEWMGAP